MNSPPLDMMVPEYVRNFETYIPSPPAEEMMQLFGCSRLIRLNNNENPLGPPPEAARILSRLSPADVVRYPSGDCRTLRRKLAGHLNVEPEQILFGNGANEVIAFVIKAFCEQGDNILTADRTFAVYEWIAHFSGIETKLAPLKDFGFDEEAIFSMVNSRTKLIFICNPNNPTGTWWDRTRLMTFLDRLGSNHIVVLDEAYCEFVEEPDYPDGISLLQLYPNLIIFRTFSKMFGLAGLRIGYLVASQQIVDIIRKTCIVYSVNSVAQQTAIAAFGDVEFIEKSRQMAREGRQYLVALCNSLKLQLLTSPANFCMIRLPLSDTMAQRLLMKDGIMVRTMTPFRFPNWVRVTISTMPDMENFGEAFTRMLVGHRVSCDPWIRQSRSEPLSMWV